MSVSSYQNNPNFLKQISITGVGTTAIPNEVDTLELIRDADGDEIDLNITSGLWIISFSCVLNADVGHPAQLQSALVYAVNNAGVKVVSTNFNLISDQIMTATSSTIAGYATVNVPVATTLHLRVAYTNPAPTGNTFVPTFSAGAKLTAQCLFPF
jgi:hypothetical protein